MENQPNKSSSHAVYSLKLHIVFVTKYRRKILTPDLLDSLQGAFGEILSDWRCTLLEFGGEADHVHLLAEIHPALNISSLVANLKTARSRRARNRFSEHLKPFYQKPSFWHRAYYVGSVGRATLEPFAGMSKAKAPKKNPERPNRPLDRLLAYSLRRGMRGQMFKSAVSRTDRNILLELFRSRQRAMHGGSTMKVSKGAGAALVGERPERKGRRSFESSSPVCPGTFPAKPVLF